MNSFSQIIPKAFLRSKYSLTFFPTQKPPGTGSNRKKKTANHTAHFNKKVTFSRQQQQTWQRKLLAFECRRSRKLKHPKCLRGSTVASKGCSRLQTDKAKSAALRRTTFYVQSYFHKMCTQLKKYQYKI